MTSMAVPEQWAGAGGHRAGAWAAGRASRVTATGGGASPDCLVARCRPPEVAAILVLGSLRVTSARLVDSGAVLEVTAIPGGATVMIPSGTLTTVTGPRSVVAVVALAAVT